MTYFLPKSVHDIKINLDNYIKDLGASISISNRLHIDPVQISSFPIEN